MALFGEAAHRLTLTVTPPAVHRTGSKNGNEPESAWTIADSPPRYAKHSDKKLYNTNAVSHKKRKDKALSKGFRKEVEQASGQT